MEKDSFESLLKKQLDNHEMPVDSTLWKNVAAQAGISGGGAGLGFAGWVGIAFSVVAITVGLIYFTSDKDGALKKESNQKEAKVTNKDSKKPELNPLLDQKEGKGAFTEHQEETNGPALPLNTSNVLDEPPGYVSNEPTLGVLSNNQELNETEGSTKNETPVEAQSTIAAAQTLQTNQNPIISAVDQLNPKTILMPNAITPNGDGINDVLSLNTEGLTDFSLVILDATNQVIYSTSDLNFIWRGQLLNGDPTPAGTYQYYYTAKDSNGTWCNQFSTLTVLR